jgi:hypothetical protein
VEFVSRVKEAQVVNRDSAMQGILLKAAEMAMLRARVIVIVGVKWASIHLLLHSWWLTYRGMSVGGSGRGWAVSSMGCSSLLFFFSSYRSSDHQFRCQAATRSSQFPEVRPWDYVDDHAIFGRLFILFHASFSDGS